MSRVESEGWEPFKTMPDIYVDCPMGGSGCYEWAKDQSNYGSDVYVYLYRFYEAYDKGQLKEFYSYHESEARELFPDIEERQPGAMDSLKMGFYGTRISRDSSIFILRDTTLENPYIIGNLVYVFKRS